MVGGLEWTGWDRLTGFLLFFSFAFMEGYLTHFAWYSPPVRQVVALVSFDSAAVTY